MSSFIEEIAAKIHRDHKSDLDNVTIIFPNRRAGLFFRKTFATLINKPVWMPRITSFEDFVLSSSHLKKIDTLEAVFLLYEAFKSYPNKEEPFDKFFFWGEMILRDFEEIDQYLVDADKIFTSIKSQKELEEEFYFLDEKDQKIISSFWATFLPEASKTQHAFLATWKILRPVYHDFKKSLISLKKGYNGLIYREYLDQLKSQKPQSITGHMIFAGFNALTSAEEQIITHHITEYDAEMIWDLDAYYMNDVRQEAGFFLRKYQKSTIFGSSFPSDIPDHFRTPKNITDTGVSLEVGQTKAMGDKLKMMLEHGELDPEKTVIVLPQEYMLLPALHSLPDGATNINITMGYPMSDTPVYSLIEGLLLLQASRNDDLVQGTSFYHRPVVRLLEHPLLYHIGKSHIDQVIKNIRKKNLIVLYENELPDHHELFRFIFSKPEDPMQYLMVVMKSLHKITREAGNDFDAGFITGFYEQISRLKDLIGKRSYQLSYDFLIKLFRRMSRSLKIPFTGEPLEGLQIMGVLETRNLDFDTVFILNMNEDSWPAPPRRGSFIPYNIRKAFDLPVYEHQDAIYAYLFYRLLQRAKNIFFYHNIVSEFNVNGEPSRFVRQLEVESGHLVKKTILANPIKVNPPLPIIIQKSDDVIAKLNRFLIDKSDGRSRLTPSALDTYLYCSLRFYFRYVEELYDPDQLQEEMDPMVFGNILHDAMEILYKQFISKQKRDVIQANDFFWLEGGIDGAINKAFMKHYHVKNSDKFKLEGRNTIAADMIHKTALKILNSDRQYAPFRIIGLESSAREGYKVDYPIRLDGEEHVVGLKGKIDRIDIKEGKIRVIDYKTGRDKREFTSTASLIDRDDKNRNKAVFQVFFYSFLFEQTSSEKYERIEPGLFNSKDLFNDQFTWHIQQKNDDGSLKLVEDFREYSESFNLLLDKILTDIWDRDQVFDQVSDVKKCAYCSFSEICSRGLRN